MGLIKFEPSGWNKIEEITRTKPAQSNFQKLSPDRCSSSIGKPGGDIEAVPNIEEWGEVDSMNDLNSITQPNDKGSSKILSQTWVEVTSVFPV